MEERRLSRLESVVDKIPAQLTKILVAHAQTDGKVDNLADKYELLAKDVKDVVTVAGENKLNIVKILAWSGLGGVGGGGFIILLLNVFERFMP